MWCLFPAAYAGLRAITLAVRVTRKEENPRKGSTWTEEGELIWGEVHAFAWAVQDFWGEGGRLTATDAWVERSCPQAAMVLRRADPFPPWVAHNPLLYNLFWPFYYSKMKATHDIWCVYVEQLTEPRDGVFLADDV